MKIVNEPNNDENPNIDPLDLARLQVWRENIEIIKKEIHSKRAGLALEFLELELNRQSELIAKMMQLLEKSTKYRQ